MPDISPRVFISYSRDSDAHANDVRQLSDRLRSNGIDCNIDQYIVNPSQGWPLWMDEQVENSDFVLVVFSQGYTTKSREPKKTEERFESVLMLSDLFNAGMINDKFIPVVFKPSNSQHVVKWLRDFNQYCIDGDDGYESLRRRLLDDPPIKKPPLGPPTKQGPVEPSVIAESTLGKRKPSAPPPVNENFRLIGLPFRPSRHFTGRDAEIDRLISQLSKPAARVSLAATIEGIGGIGKTELVIQLLNTETIKGLFNTVLWLDGSSALEPQWYNILNVLGGEKVSKLDRDELRSRVNSALAAQGNVLLVLDNATQWSSVRELLPISYPLLVTTRTHKFGGAQFDHQEIREISDDAAQTLLISLAPDVSLDESISELLTRLAGHPLAIELAAGVIDAHGYTCEKYLSLLAENPSDTKPSTDTLDGVRYGESLDACVEASWNSLNSNATKTLWTRAAMFAPTCASRELLSVSFAGTDVGRQILTKTDTENSGVQGAVDNGTDSEFHVEEGRFADNAPDFVTDAINEYLDETMFSEAFSELRLKNVLSRVEESDSGFRWAMHRVVRDFARKRETNSEFCAHAISLSSWIDQHRSTIAQDAPHFAQLLLDVTGLATASRSSEEVPESDGESWTSYDELDTSELTADHLEQRDNQHTIANRLSPVLPATLANSLVAYVRRELEGPEVLPIIFSGLASNDESLREQAIELIENMGYIPEVLETLVTLLGDPNDDVRRRAARTITLFGGPKVIDLLCTVASDESANDTTRTTAVTCLRRFGIYAAEAHKSLLEVSHNSVRLETALSLAECGDASGLSIIEAHSEAIDLQGSEARRAINAIVESVSSEHVSILHRYAANSESQIASIATRGLGKLVSKDTGARDALAELLAMAAASATDDVIELPAEEVAEELLGESLNRNNDSSSSVIVESLNAFVKNRIRLQLDSNTRSALLTHALANVRDLAIKFFDIQDNRLVDTELEVAVSDDDENVRATAARIITQQRRNKQMDSSLAVRLVEILLKSTSKVVRKESVRALGFCDSTDADDLLVATIETESETDVLIQSTFTLINRGCEQRIVDVMRVAKSKDIERYARVIAVAKLTDSVRLVANWLNSSDEETRLAAVKACGPAGITSELQAELEQLAENDKSEEVRRNALNTLSVSGTVDDLTNHIKSLSDENVAEFVGFLSEVALFSEQEVPLTSIVEPLMKCFREADKKTRLTIVSLLGYVPSAVTRNALREIALKDSDDDIQKRAAAALLGSVCMPGKWRACVSAKNWVEEKPLISPEHLIEVLDGASDAEEICPRAMLAIAQSLADGNNKLPSSECYMWCERMISSVGMSDDVVERRRTRLRFAAEGLGQYVRGLNESNEDGENNSWNPRVQPVAILIWLTRSEFDEVRSAAAISLAKIGDKFALARIEELRDADRSDSVRSVANELLAEARKRNSSD